MIRKSLPISVCMHVHESIYFAWHMHVRCLCWSHLMNEQETCRSENLLPSISVCLKPDYMDWRLQEWQKVYPLVKDYEQSIAIVSYEGEEINSLKPWMEMYFLAWISGQFGHDVCFGKSHWVTKIPLNCCASSLAMVVPHSLLPSGYYLLNFGIRETS